MRVLALLCCLPGLVAASFSSFGAYILRDGRRVCQGAFIGINKIITAPACVADAGASYSIKHYKGGRGHVVRIAANEAVALLETERSFRVEPVLVSNAEFPYEAVGQEVFFYRQIKGKARRTKGSITATNKTFIAVGDPGGSNRRSCESEIGAPVFVQADRGVEVLSGVSSGPCLSTGFNTAAASALANRGFLERNGVPLPPAPDLCGAA